jgi:ankyrin repeat protein
MPRQLTSASSLEGLKKEAKRWLRALRAGDPEARRRLESVDPRAPATPGLREIQHALALEHGRENWAAIKTALEDLALARRSHAERVHDFLELACLHYGVAPGARSYSDYPESPDRRRQALRILARYPEVGRDSLHTAVVCGDRDEVARMLAERPEAARERGGREGWEPLLFLCYGRLPVEATGSHAVEIARALLDHGASPDAAWSYDWNGRRMTWSAVCGVVGEGEKGAAIAPPHPQAEALAALLLERGADCNQSQALYNTMLRGDDDRWLRVLVDRGLSARHPIAWEGSDGEAGIFDYLLEHAVGMNQLRRATLLLTNGASPHGTKAQSLYLRALLGGNLEMAELLARHGALRVELTGREAFRAACMRLDAEEARRLLAADPTYADEADLLLVDEACKRDLVELARLLLDMGASPDAERIGPDGRYRALHQAACVDAAAVATLLLERGAQVDARDVAFRATPLGWALHTHQPAAIALFSSRTHDIFTVVAGGLTDQVRRLLRENQALANSIAEAPIGLGILEAQPGETPLFVLPDDEERALEVAELLLACGADRSRRNHAGQTAAERARARGLGEVAEFLT